MFSCSNKQNLAIGTWINCSKDGSYREYKITKDYFLFINSNVGHIWVYKCKILDNAIVISDLDSKFPPLINPDTFKIKSLNDQKILLRSTYTGDRFELQKAKFEIEPIDFSNLKNWKKKIQAQFKKREELKNCKDLRTKSEKEIHTVNMDSLKTEKIQIIIIDKKTGISDTIWN